MKKLNIPNGGMPLEGDDFNWIHGGVLDALKAIYFSFGKLFSGNFIISGCEVSFAGGFATITEGYVMLDWEICYCPSHSVGVASLSASSLKLQVTNDPAGTEVFADSVSRDTYENRRAMISDGLNSGIEIVLNSAPRYSYEVAISGYVGNWGAAPGSSPKLTKLGDIVFVSGSIIGGDTNLQGFTVPVEFRPSENRYCSVRGGSLTVFPNGAVSVYDFSGNQTTITAPFGLEFFYRL